MNRRIRDPYVRWCERRSGGHKVVTRLLDWQLALFNLCFASIPLLTAFIAIEDTKTKIAIITI